ncbi:hypothetical protein L596_023465 [Steinernema carpocapsae]|uniref:Uncharacterized protein n=1 Tax=Steinernema carpocapsae TaxID=34508 RepID=A0A4U5MDQ9_STECR|nr:hypothetical protein L596_023465 [Steinernema carpocapsae]
MSEKSAGFDVHKVRRALSWAPGIKCRLDLEKTFETRRSRFQTHLSSYFLIRINWLNSQTCKSTSLRLRNPVMTTKSHQIT